MKRNYLYYLLTILLLAVSCEKDEMACTTTVETQEVSSIAATTAQCGGIISSDGNPTIKEAGVECCTTSDFESNVSCASIAKAKLGKFACEIIDLKDNTQYYVRAYARNSYGTIYGEVLSFKTLEIVLPAVLTDSVTNITISSATVGGEVTDESNGVVAERGVVYSTNPNPTVENNKVVCGRGKGAFTCNLTDLQDGVTYYVRAYAVNQKGTAYGEEKSFTTKAITIPTVTTSSATNISVTSATVGGNVTDDGGATVTERGVVYSTNPSPTVENNKVVCSRGKGAFTCNLTDLQDGVTYYVRAYAVNEKGIAYGEQQSFMTKKAGIFSVSSSKQVVFSSGNLQYHPANNKWRFAENQTDYVGDANANISSTYNGWLDLFGWSTSATNFGVSTSTNSNDYSGSFVDWGTNKIGNDAPNTWRTLTFDEWKYLRYARTNADDLVGIAQVNGVNGLILLPDIWTCPAGVTFKSGFYSGWGVDYYAAYQTFTAEQWSKLESAGAVFLPAAGYRGGSEVGLLQNYGYYWSATEGDSSLANYLFFYPAKANMDGSSRRTGQSVRLVKDL